MFMQHLETCRTWKGRRVWLASAAGDAGRVDGEIAKADASFLTAGDVDLAIRLGDGRVEMVLASEKGTRWDFVA
jgi:hypothetical protein